MTSVSEILSYDKSSAQDDYYQMLGCDQTSTVSRLRLLFYVMIIMINFLRGIK